MKIEAANVATEGDVRLTAYFLWEQDGRPDGEADVHWSRALEFHRTLTGQGKSTDAHEQQSGSRKEALDSDA